MKKKDRVSTEAKGESLGDNPFGGIDLSEIRLVEGRPDSGKPSLQAPVHGKKGRVDLRREKSGRGGKTVTVLEGIGNAEDRKDLLKTLQKQCGCGGTIKEEVIEIQGDKRDEVAKVLKDQGYRVVLSGG